MSQTIISPSLGISEVRTLDNIVHALKQMLPGDLSIIDNEAEKSFYEFVKTSSVDRSAFSYNWPYIIQATRNRGYCYHSKNSIVYFYFRNHPKDSRDFRLIVVNHLGNDSEDSVSDLAYAAMQLSIATIVKNVDLDKVQLWKCLGFEETSEPWSEYSFRDDNTFPELVYDINRFINRRFNSSTRCIINKLLREKECTFLPYVDSFRESGLELLKRNAEYLQNKGVDFKNEVIKAHEFVFDDSINNKIMIVALEGNRLVCLSFLTRVGENLFFNAIINQNQSNLMRFFLWKSVAYYCDGLELSARPKYLALQGSENEGQHKWKEYFNPIRIIPRTHVTNRHHQV